MLFRRLTPAFAPQTLGVLGCYCQVKFLSLNFQTSYEDFSESANIIEVPYGVLTTYAKACSATCSHETISAIEPAPSPTLPSRDCYPPHFSNLSSDSICSGSFFQFFFTDIDSTFPFFINASQGPQK